MTTTLEGGEWSAAIYPSWDRLPILQEAVWAPGPVWTGGISYTHRDSIPDHPARKIPYIWQCNIRMLARSNMIVSVLLIVEVSLFHTKCLLKPHEHGQERAVSHHTRCLIPFWSTGLYKEIHECYCFFLGKPTNTPRDFNSLTVSVSLPYKVPYK